MVHSLHASQKVNAVLQCITSSEECKTQDVDTLALHGIPEASAAALPLAAAILNCREPRIAQQEGGGFKKSQP